MAKMQVFTLENLQQYDGLIKNYIDTADAKSLKTVALVGNTLKFYKVEEPVGDTTPAYEITLPETDVSGLLEKLTGATEDNVVTVGADGTVKDSGIKSADLALKSEVEAVSDAVEALNNADTGILAQAQDYVDTEIQELVDGAIKDNADAIAAINNADTGILKTAQTYADEKVEDLAEGQVKTNTDAIATLNGDASTDGSVAKAVKDASDAINAVIGEVEEGKTVVGMIEDVIANGYDDTEVRELIGDVTTLKTTEKDSVVGAINEVSDAVATAVDGAKVTVTTDTTTEGYLKTYTIKQGDTEISKIDIPKDLVVTAGEVVVDPDGQAAGTYVKLTIANQETPIYINVADLVDAYTAQASATQIQLAISDTNEISATIVAGSVGTTELADSAVTTAKIADGNVTLAKLGSDVTVTLEQVATNKTDIEALKTLTGEGIEAIPESAITALFS